MTSRSTLFRVNSIPFQASIGREQTLSHLPARRSAVVEANSGTEILVQLTSREASWSSIVNPGDMCHILTVSLFVQIAAWVSAIAVCPASSSAFRLTLFRPHNLSVTFSIWSRDDDTSNLWSTAVSIHVPTSLLECAYCVCSEMSIRQYARVSLDEEEHPLRASLIAVSTVSYSCQIVCWS